MRLFVAAIPKNLAANARLTQTLGKLKRTLGDKEEPVRWTPPALWHVTLVFLGDRTEEDHRRIETALDRWVPPAAPKMSFRGFGAFPSSEEGRVLWVGVHKDQALLDLQSSLESALMEKNVLARPEQEYHPHLTLVRFRHTRNLQSLIQLGGRASFGEEVIEEIVLFESVIQGNMTKYIPRFVKSISGSDPVPQVQREEY